MEKEPITGVILAAGISKRMGMPKQILKLGGKFVINRCVDAALASLLDSVILVIGCQKERIISVLKDRIDNPKLRIVLNPDYTEGMSASLRRGVHVAADNSSAIMFLLGDQPLLNTETINYMIERYRISEKNICVPTCKKKRKNPVILGNKYYDAMLGITGDIGAREIIKQNLEDVLYLEINNPAFFKDIDTKKDFDGLKRFISADPQDRQYLFH